MHVKGEPVTVGQIIQFNVALRVAKKGLDRACDACMTNDCGDCQVRLSKNKIMEVLSKN